MPLYEEIKDYDVDLYNQVVSARTKIKAELYSPDIIRATHLYSLLKPNSLHDRVVATLMHYEWVIFLSNEDFFTSDNPGYSLGSDNIVHNTKFEGEFFFFFPLAPNRCLVIKESPIDMKYYDDSTVKKVTYVDTPADVVARINNMILSNVNRYLISHDEDKLNMFAKNIRKI